MAYLIETSILARLANTKDIQHAVAARAVLELVANTSAVLVFA